MQAILERLADGRPVPISQLAPGELDDAALRMMVGMLLQQGLVAITAD
jgi:hypothetical protein